MLEDKKSYVDEKIPESNNSYTDLKVNIDVERNPLTQISETQTQDVLLYHEFMESLKNFEKEALINANFKLLCKPNRLSLNQSYQHHQLCDQLTAISKKLQGASAHTKNNWKKYLEEINFTSLIYADTLTRKLKTKIAIKLIDHELPLITTNKLSTLCDKDIKEIIKVEKESFTSMELISVCAYDSLKHEQRLKHAQAHTFYVARDTQNNNKIIGVLEYEAKNQLIFSIARKAMYAQCRVGSLLWQEFSKDVFQEKVTLYTRESNPAIKAYKR